jgi:magnesium-transporting ATPase (P-type)
MIQQFCDWLSATPLSIAFQSANWFVPTVQTVHIIAIAILLTSIYLVSFRLLRPGSGSPPLSAIMSTSSPWIWGTFIVLLVTGALLTITEPDRELLNWAFRTKMILVLVLAIVVAFVQRRVRHDPNYWTASAGRRWLGKAVAILVILIGAAIITAGRWIAYV